MRWNRSSIERKTTFLLLKAHCIQLESFKALTNSILLIGKFKRLSFLTSDFLNLQVPGNCLDSVISNRQVRFVGQTLAEKKTVIIICQKLFKRSADH